NRLMSSTLARIRRRNCEPAAVYGLVGAGASRATTNAMTHLKIIVERHADGYVAYPVGLKGVVIGQGDSYDEALSDVRSAIRFHLETFGPDAIESDSPVL